MNRLLGVLLLCGILGLSWASDDESHGSKKGIGNGSILLLTPSGDPVNAEDGSLEPAGSVEGGDEELDNSNNWAWHGGVGSGVDDTEILLGMDKGGLLREASTVDEGSDDEDSDDDLNMPKSGETDFVGAKCGNRLLGPRQVCCEISGKLFPTSPGACKKSKKPTLKITPVPASMPVSVPVTGGDKKATGGGKLEVNIPKLVIPESPLQVPPSPGIDDEGDGGFFFPVEIPRRATISKLDLEKHIFGGEVGSPPLMAPRPRDAPLFGDESGHAFPETDVIPDVMKNDAPLKAHRYEFDASAEGMEDVEVEVGKLAPGSEGSSTSKLVTPEEMLKLLEDDEFVNKILDSLKNVYAAKFNKYERLLKIVQEQVASDISEKEKMKAGGISDRELQKTFPMLTVNLGLRIKVKKLRAKARELYRALENATTAEEQKALRNVVRENFRRAINDENDGILSVTGKNRQHIRDQLATKLYILSRGFRPFMDSFMNMQFVGDAGVGKTKLAKVVGFVFQQSGVLIDGDVNIVSPKDLVGEYIGQTAGKTAGVLMNSIEGVVFIDEAYQIMPCTPEGTLDTKGKQGFGPEAITEIVNYLDKYIGLSVMIVAGYEREMTNCFMAANSGLPRRFPSKITLPKYTTSDLLNIFLNVASKKLGKAYFDQSIARYIYTVMAHIREEDPNTFQYQAGDIMNLVSNFLNVVYGSWTRDWFAGGTDVQVDIVNDMFNEYLRNKGYEVVTDGGKVAVQKLRPARAATPDSAKTTSVSGGDGSSEVVSKGVIPDDVIVGTLGQAEDEVTDKKDHVAESSTAEVVVKDAEMGSEKLDSAEKSDSGKTTEVGPAEKATVAEVEKAEKDAIDALKKDGEN